MDHSAENPITLAFLGDAVYELYVRRHVMDKVKGADLLHRRAVSYVKAPAQAAIVKSLLPQLSETETGVVKRARNHKTATKAKNATAVEYKLATGFEALIGYLYLSGQQERLEEIISESFRIIEEEN